MGEPYDTVPYEGEEAVQSAEQWQKQQQEGRSQRPCLPNSTPGSRRRPPQRKTPWLGEGDRREPQGKLGRARTGAAGIEVPVEDLRSPPSPVDRTLSAVPENPACPPTTLWLNGQKKQREETTSPLVRRPAPYLASESPWPPCANCGGGGGGERPESSLRAAGVPELVAGAGRQPGSPQEVPAGEGREVRGGILTHSRLRGNQGACTSGSLAWRTEKPCCFSFKSWNETEGAETRSLTAT
ncbi:uncharacterized protein LOC143832251 [Paroedura picta]|uniref:uncharacterized protein LOC143832251 n=1 Tax=Paroedura picta TaxID=143630 RepID=UPI0040574852